MAYLNLLAANPEDVGLDTFAPRFFKALGVVAFEERESGNYVDGHYYKGRSGDLSITVSMAEEVDHVDLPIWVQISDEAVADDGLRHVVAELVREKILPQGFKCARMINFGRIDEQRIDYLSGA